MAITLLLGANQAISVRLNWTAITLLVGANQATSVRLNISQWHGFGCTTRKGTEQHPCQGK